VHHHELDGRRGLGPRPCFTAGGRGRGCPRGGRRLELRRQKWVGGRWTSPHLAYPQTSRLPTLPTSHRTPGVGRSAPENSPAQGPERRSHAPTLCFPFCLVKWGASIRVSKRSGSAETSREAFLGPKVGPKSPAECVACLPPKDQAAILTRKVQLKGDRSGGPTTGVRSVSLDRPRLPLSCGFAA
jgi:hypothetical protein